MKKYIFLFILSLVFFIVIKSPASLLQQYFPDYQLSGRVINGTAIHKKIGVINWQFNPKLLLIGRVAFNLQIINTHNKVHTNLAIDLFGNILINNTQGLVDINYLRQFNQNIPEIANATIKINSLDGTIKDTKTLALTEMNSKLNITKLNILGEKLGDYQASIVTKNNHKTATVNSYKTSVFKTNANLSLNKNILKINGSIIANTEAGQTLLKTLGIQEKLNYKIPIKL